MKIVILLFAFIARTYGANPQNTPTCPDATYNLLIVLDESGSIGLANYQFTVQFVIDLINNEISDNSPTAAVAFAMSNDMIWGFGDDQTNRAGILAALQAEMADFDSGGTSTFSAMEYAVNEFQANNISPDDNNLIFLFTDGVPTPQFNQRVCEPLSGPIADRFLNRRAGLEALDDLNIRVVVIALNGFDPDPLKCLYDDLFVGMFTSEDFATIEDGLVDVLCEDAPPSPTIPCPPSVYNLLFILDESGSVGSNAHAMAVQFVIDFIMNDINPNSPAAAVAFGSNNDPVYTFLQTQNPRDGILAALQAEKTDFDNGGTNTKAALVYAINEFNTIAPSSNNIIFLFTDGGPSDNPCLSPTMKDPSLSALDTLGIRIILIAIGSFNPVPLQCLHSDSDLFAIDGFTSNAFDQIEEQLNQVLCTINVCPCYSDLDPSLTYCLSGCCDVGVLAKTKCDGIFIDYGVREDDKSCFIQTNGTITTEFTGLTSTQYYDCESILIEAAQGDNCTISDTIDHSIFSAIKLFINRINNADAGESMFEMHLILYILFVLMFVGTIIGLICICLLKIKAYFGCSKSDDYVSLTVNEDEIVSAQA